MHLRGILALSLCALLGVGSSAFAEGKASTSSFKTESVASAQNPKREKTAKAKKPLDPKAAAAAKKAAEKTKAAEAAKAKAEEKKKLAAKAKADAAKKLAEKKKAEDAKKLAKAKALEEKKAAAKAKADAAQAARVAKAKAAEQAKLARLQAIEDAKQARIRAAEQARQAEIAQLTSLEIAKSGNNGELRSEVQAPRPTGFLALFGAAPKASMLAETRALDAVLDQREAKRKFRVKADFEPQTVSFPGYSSGTIVIDTESRYLYLVQSSSKARRYAIAVGKDGLQFKGSVVVGDKQEWPRWIPTLDMQKRDPKKYGPYKHGMAGGPDNPLGARAIYLYQGRKDTHLRIHGTNQPETIGTSASNGCFRMVNDHVQDLYSRVRLGTQVIVM